MLYIHVVLCFKINYHI